MMIYYRLDTKSNTPYMEGVEIKESAYAILYLHVWLWVITVDFGHSNRRYEGLPDIFIEWD